MMKMYNIVVITKAYNEVVDGLLGKLVFDTERGLKRENNANHRLFGVRRFSGDRKHHYLEDNWYGNITLHMTNKDKSLTGIVH